MLHLSMLIIQTGIFRTFITAWFPHMIEKEMVGYVMGTYGLTECLGSFVLGNASDRWGCPAMIFLSLALEAVSMASLYAVRSYEPYSFFVTAALLGVPEAGLNTLLYAILYTSFEKGAAYKFLVSVSIGCGALLGVITTQATYSIAVFGMAAVAAVMFVWLTREIGWKAAPKM